MPCQRLSSSYFDSMQQSHRTYQLQRLEGNGSSHNKMPTTLRLGSHTSHLGKQGAVRRQLRDETREDMAVPLQPLNTCSATMRAMNNLSVGSRAAPM
eukprot:6213430-Pleurochrysis_carterae.AAC.1